MTSKSSTPVKLGLVILVVLAGLVAVAANFGILTAHRSSPDVGVLSATEVSQPLDTAAVTADTAPATGPESTQPVATDGRHDKDSDEHDKESGKHDEDSDKHSDKHRKGHDDDDD